MDGIAGLGAEIVIEKDANMPTLDWIGKKAVENHHKEVPYRLLRCNPELSVGEPGSGNLLVQGDNLEALKALLPYYGGKVKCIYIDPPYNTGNENWVYNDAVNSPEMRQWLGDVVGRDDLSRHDKWLCMMYPRLIMLKQFLRDDGSIWISIDDTEVYYLRNIMNEIFGEEHFVACNVWQKRYSRENREAIGDVHEYILVYAMNPELFKQLRNRVEIGEQQRKLYKNPNNDPRGPWQSVSLSAQGWRPNQMYEIISPSGKKHIPPEGRCWSMTEPEYEKLREDGRIWFGKNGTGVPRVVYFLSEALGLVPWTWWPHEEVGHTDEARKEIQSIFGTQTAFDTPKPVRLLKRILQISTNPGDIVLDSFSGSGTTGHTVLELNKYDDGDRRFLLVEMDAQIASNVTSRRLKSAIDGYENKKQQEVPGLGGGFRFCELGETLFEADGTIRSAVRFRDLAHHVFFTEMREPLPESCDGKSPLLGVARGTAVYLLYNGILKDKRPKGGNVLTMETLRLLPSHDGPRIVYGTACTLGAGTLKRHGITFRQIPYEVKDS